MSYKYGTGKERMKITAFISVTILCSKAKWNYYNTIPLDKILPEQHLQQKYISLGKLMHGFSVPEA